MAAGPKHRKSMVFEHLQCYVIDGRMDAARDLCLILPRFGVPVQSIVVKKPQGSMDDVNDDNVGLCKLAESFEKTLEQASNQCNLNTCHGGKGMIALPSVRRRRGS